MTGIESMLAEPLGQAIGYTLLHFIWQGAFVALGLFTILKLMHGHSAQARYAVSCGALLLLLVLPIITLAVVYPASQSAPAAPTILESPFREAAADRAEETVPLSEANVQPGKDVAWPAVLLPWLVSFWMIGVLVLSVRYLVGWTYTVHLRRRVGREVGEQWKALLDEAARKLDLRRPVRLAASARVQVPMVVGWLRPVILMPVAVLTGLSVLQIEMILVHELAHVRRHDYLVSLAQAIVETLLFYHPAVWWISQRIRIEREHCCDDVVVAVCGDAVRYAGTLAQLEVVRQNAFRLMPAATGGSLLDRIQRLLEDPEESSTRAMRWMVGFLLIGMLLVGLQLRTVVQTVWERAAGTEAAEERASRQAHSEAFAEMFESEIDEERNRQIEVWKELREMFEKEGHQNSIFKTIPFSDADEHQRKVEVYTEMIKEIQKARMQEYQQYGEIRTPLHILIENINSERELSDEERKKVRVLEQFVFDGKPLEQKQALDALMMARGSYQALQRIVQSHPSAEIQADAAVALARRNGKIIQDQEAQKKAETLERLIFEEEDLLTQKQVLDALLLHSHPYNYGILGRIVRLHPRAEIRAAAVPGLARMGGADAAPTLEYVAFEDVDATVQLSALKALIRLADEEAVPALTRIAARHPRAIMREGAEQGMAEKAAKARMHATRALSNYDAILSQLDQALDAEADAAAQQEFLETLWARLALEMEMIESRKQAKLEKPMSFQEVAERLDHPLAHIRADAVERLSESQDEGVLNILIQRAFDDASLRVQLKALEGLQKRRGGSGLEWIEHIAKEHVQEAMRTEAVRTLGQQGSAEVGPTLEHIVFEDESPAVKREALDALRALPGNAGRTHLDRIAEAHPEPWMRSEARR